jgi:uncharacterized protein YciI
MTIAGVSASTVSDATAGYPRVRADGRERASLACGTFLVALAGIVNYNEAEAYEFAASVDRAIYYVYLLRKGPTWSPDSTPEVDALQEAHLANLRRLMDAGKLVLNGPLLDAFQLSGEIRSIGVLKASSLTEAQEWISTDPMVKDGRLVVEVHAWMVPKGILP